MTRHRVPLIVASVVLTGVCLCLLLEPPVVATARDQFFDLYQRLVPRAASTRSVSVVAIDDASLDRYGQWPWPRRLLAELVTSLDRAGAALIAFDILFSEPDRTTVEMLAGEPAMKADAVLAAAIAAGRVVTAFALLPADNGVKPQIKARFLTAGGDPRPLLADFAGALTSQAPLEQAASGNGAVNVGLGRDSVVRAIPLVLRLNEALMPSLVAESLRVAQGIDDYVIDVETAGTPDAATASAIRAIYIGAYKVPTTIAGELRFYAADPELPLPLPAWRILSGEADLQQLRGAIVLVGASATGLQDLRRTPLGVMPGVSIHAQAIEQIIDETYLVRPDWAKASELAYLLAMTALLLLVGSRFGALTTAAVGALAAAGIAAVSWYAFSEHRLLIDAAGPAVAVFLVWLVFSVAHQLQVEQEGRWIRKAFNSYVAPRVVRELIDYPDHLKLSGERRDLSFVYTDLEGFTALIEASEPEQVLPVLNQYLDGLVRIAFRFEGTVDKIVGDAVHVIFGAPVATSDHAARAVACALAMNAFSRDFAISQRSQGLTFGRTRIGINSGAAIVGNFGGDLRFTYTAHGDAVNTAARLEGANRSLGTTVLVSEATVNRFADFQGRPAATLQLKGKKHWVRVFEPISPDELGSPRVANYIDAYALLALGDGGAQSAFQSLFAKWPDDPLIQFHYQRLRQGAADDRVVLATK